MFSKINDSSEIGLAFLFKRRGCVRLEIFSLELVSFGGPDRWHSIRIING